MSSFTTKRDELKKVMAETITKEDAKKAMASTYKQSRITLDHANDTYVTKVANLCGITKTCVINHLLDYIRLHGFKDASRYLTTVTGTKLE